MNEFSLSSTVISSEGDRLYTFEHAALVTETSTVAPGFRIESGWSSHGARYGAENCPTSSTVRSIAVLT